MFPVSYLHDKISQKAFRENLMTNVLPEYLLRQRWFMSKGKSIDHIHWRKSIPVTELTAIILIDVVYTNHTSETYQLPIAQWIALNLTDEWYEKHQHVVLMTLDNGDLLIDAVILAEFRSNMFRFIRTDHHDPDGLICEAGHILQQVDYELMSTVPNTDTSNTVIFYGDEFFFKLFRRLDPGINPELEISRYLSEDAQFPYSPPYGGSVSIDEQEDDRKLNLGILTRLVDNQGDAWDFFHKLTHDYYTSEGSMSDITRQRVQLLGLRTAQLHQALSRATHPDMQPQAFTRSYRLEIAKAAEDLLQRQFDELSAKIKGLSADMQTLAQRVLDHEPQLKAQLNKLREAEMNFNLIRIHGDYHLGQVLVTEDDYVIIDFEGEPLLPISQRRRKRPALKDVAGMIRSFHYAAYAPWLLKPEQYDHYTQDEMMSRANSWFELATSEFLTAYFNQCGEAEFLPRSSENRERLLDLFVLEKAIYEVAYELNSRPDWLSIPLQGVITTLDKNIE